SPGVSPQLAQVNTPYLRPPTVTVFDAGGTRVPGVAVTFSAPPTGASGVFASTGSSTATVSTNGLGVASAPLTANETDGAYTVSVDGGGLTLAGGLSLTNVAPPTAVVASQGT